MYALMVSHGVLRMDGFYIFLAEFVKNVFITNTNQPIYKNTVNNTSENVQSETDPDASADGPLPTT